MKSPRGYLAVELVMGLLVGLVLTGMAVPQVRSGLYTYRLKGAVSSAVWAIQSTRYQALIEAYPYNRCRLRLVAGSDYNHQPVR